MSSKLAFAALLLCLPSLVLAEPARVQQGNLILENIPTLPASLGERLGAYDNTRSASLAGWLPGEAGLVVSTRFGESQQLHRVARAGAARQQLSFGREPVLTALPLHRDDLPWIVFLSDIGGNEYYQIQALDWRSGQRRLLTDGVSRNGSPVLSRDHRQLAYHSTRRNGRDFDLYLDQLGGTPAPRLILEVSGDWAPIDFSPDGKSLLVMERRSIVDSVLYRLELASGTPVRIFPTEGTAAISAAQFTPDGAGVLLVTDQGERFLGLQRLDLESGALALFGPARDWDVDGLASSRDGSRIAVGFNVEGGSEVLILDTESGRILHRMGPGLDRVSAVAFHEDGRRLALTMSSATVPGDVFVLDLAADPQLTRWTESELGGLNPETLIAPSLIRYPSFDEVDGAPRAIPAFYFRPRGEGPFPVVIDIHGGPESQRRPGFDPWSQFLLNDLGVAVLWPNVRGSSGYGRDYLSLDDGKLREDSVRDIGALLDWLAEQPELDASRVAVTGGSYGGYMVLASLVHFGERLRAGVNSVGISNFVTFLENTHEYRRDRRRVEYGDERDPEMRAFLEQISPANSADRIRTPMLVIHGANDPRVPASEAEQILAAVRAQGIESWYLLALDEGHGFRKQSNREVQRRVTALFLERNLLPQPSAD